MSSLFETISQLKTFKQIKAFTQQFFAQLKPFAKRYGLLAGLVLAFLLTNHLLVQLTHQARNQHVKLQKLEAQQNLLEAEYSQLLLEEGALSAPARLEKLARENLGLTLMEEHQLELKEVN